MMKVRLVSDVVLEPFIKIQKSIAPDINISYSYEEDLISYLMGLALTDFEHDKILFVHSDQVFHKKSQEWQNTLLSVVASLVPMIKGKVILSNSFSLSFSSKPVSQSVGTISETYLEYKDALEAYLQNSNAYVFDFMDLCLQQGLKNVYQYTLGHLYQMPYTKNFLQCFAASFCEQLKWMHTEEKKAIVLDCDNTLWRGVIGEDGLDGIKCDLNGEGILYYQMQLFLKAKKSEGFLLCLCSKNNESDVREVFEKKNLPLVWSDFVVTKVNWQDKYDNITAIARELNIGLDSLIYIDDNPFEINSVSELIRGVSCLEFKDDYPSFLDLTKRFLFRKQQVLLADLEKTAQYQVEFQRKAEETNFASIEDFINSLNIVLDIRLNDLDDLDRLSQMTGKTNQFNFNKRSFSQDQLKEFIAEGNRVYSLKVSDKFGNYGTVGLMLLQIDGTSGTLENYLMSCRALGKRIEYEFYGIVMNKLAKEGISLENVRFKETEKNTPAQDFVSTINTNIIKVSDHAY